MQNELQSILEKEYGIQVFHEDLPKEDLKRRGYRKVSRIEVEQLNAVFRQPPYIAKDVYYADVVQKRSEYAVNGFFRVII